MNAFTASRGRVAAVTDEQILDAYHWLAASEGVFCEPASAASVAGLLAHGLPVAEGSEPPESVVCVLTGHGLKDPDTRARQGPRRDRLQSGPRRGREGRLRLAAAPRPPSAGWRRARRVASLGWSTVSAQMARWSTGPCCSRQGWWCSRCCSAS